MLRWYNNAIVRNTTVTFASLLIMTATATAGATMTSSSTANGNFGQLAISAVMGESAVVDKETGRIFWEGGSSNTLVESIAPKLRRAIGDIPHIKATILSVLLLLAAAGTLSQLLRDWLKSIRCLQTTVLAITITTHALLLLPKAPRWFILLVLTLYLLEAYTCSTHQYLRHVVNDAETYIEQLREHLPIVEWKVRSFHFENYIPFPFQKLRQLLVHNDSNLHHPTPTTFPSIFHWKRVTHSATAHYNYTSCTDQTIVGVWKRAPIVMNYHPPSSDEVSSLRRTNTDQRNQNNATAATNSTNEGATTTSQKAAKAVPTIMKMVITKTLLLKDTKTRQDYFTQQKAFLQSHKHRDEYAEFSTNVYMNNYRNGLTLPSSRILALCHAQQPQWWIHRYTYWFWTCLGLTVPYRRWLASQCDEVRVRVVKETSMEHGPNQMAISPSATTPTDGIKKKHWIYNRYTTTTSTVPS